MPNQGDLIGAQMTVKEIEQHVGASSLAYLSLERTIVATEIPADSFCTACFSSNYPIPVPSEELRTKDVLERPNITRRNRYPVV